jgi:hypothetical protein
VIWDGPVFQPLVVRENVTDLRTTLHCILSLESALSGNIVSGQFAGGANQTEIVLNMLNSLGLNKDFVSPNLSTKQLPRGKTLFGAPSKYFSQIAEDNNMIWFLSSRGITLGSLNDGLSATAPGFVYTPNTGLLGTPQQTQLGVDFSVLLDPRIKIQIPLMTVGIDQTLIQQYKKSINEVILPLDQSGTYVVGGIRHRGDSRGNAWQTDIVGYQKVTDALAWSANANINR